MAQRQQQGESALFSMPAGPPRPQERHKQLRERRRPEVIRRDDRVKTLAARQMAVRGVQPARDLRTRSRSAAPGLKNPFPMAAAPARLGRLSGLRHRDSGVVDEDVQLPEPPIHPLSRALDGPAGAGTVSHGSRVRRRATGVEQPSGEATEKPLA